MENSVTFKGSYVECMAFASLLAANSIPTQIDKDIDWCITVKCGKYTSDIVSDFISFYNKYIKE